MIRLRQTAQIEQNKGELKRIPRRRIDGCGWHALFLAFAPPCSSFHGAVRDAKSLQRLSTRSQQFDTGLDPRGGGERLTLKSLGHFAATRGQSNPARFLVRQPRSISCGQGTECGSNCLWRIRQRR